MDDRYQALRAAFRWSIPVDYNIAVECCDRWAGVAPDRVALLRYTPGEALAATTYRELKRNSDALAHALRARGIVRGDRVAILLPQSVEMSNHRAGITPQVVVGAFEFVQLFDDVERNDHFVVGEQKNGVGIVQKNVGIDDECLDVAVVAH